MTPLVFCDWTTLRATSSTTQFVQSEEKWLKLSGFRDLTAWIQVSEATSAANVRVELQASPTEDAALFETLGAASVGTGGVYVVISRANVALAPLSHILRWRVTRLGAVTWSITFRIVLALNPVVRDATFSQHTQSPERATSPSERARASPGMLRERRLAQVAQPRRR